MHHATVDDVTVEPGDPGELVVRWVSRGPASAVTVAVGPRPTEIDHDAAITVAAGERTTVLRGLDPGHHFVAVAPAGGGSAVIAAERRVALGGPRNFRDLGGYRTASGRRVAWGRVFRSDALSSLSADDQQALRRLGLRAVYDLRSGIERDADPVALVDERLARIEISLAAGSRAWRSIGQGPVVPVDEQDAEGERLLADIYRSTAGQAAPLIGRVLTGLAEPDRLPAAVFCAAGKDRTGMIAATLLLALGVDLEDVLDDYELTERYQAPERVARLIDELGGRGIPAALAGGLLRVSRSGMRLVLEETLAASEGIDGYLTGPAEMEPAAITRLRTALLV